MKKIIVLIAMSLAATSLFAQKEKPAKLERVTLYPTGALIEKSITVNLKEGENMFIITNNADRVENLNFSTSDSWFISSMYEYSISKNKDEVLKSILPESVYTKYTALKSSLDELLDKEKLELSRQSILSSQLAALLKQKSLTQPEQFDSLSLFKAQFEYQRTEVDKIHKSLSICNAELERISANKNNLNKEISSILRKYNGSQNIHTTSTNILVNIYSSVARTNEKIYFHYNSPNSSCWYDYKINIDDQSKQAVFTLNANQWQGTGETWKDCQFVFATSTISQDNFNYELQPIYASFNHPVLYSKRTKAVAYSYIAEEDAESMDAGYLDNAAPTSGQSQKAMLMASNIASQNLSREYLLNTKPVFYSFDNTKTIPLYHDTCSVEFQHYAIPKHNEKVYFSALIPSWEDLGLLNAPCNVFLNDRHVCKSAINSNNTSDTLRLTVGEDKNVKIVRKQRKSSPDKTGVFNKEIEETHSIIIDIKNNKNEQITLNLMDQVPLSNNPDIKILNIQTDGGEIDNLSGIVQWKLLLEPKQDKQVILSYTIKYPKGQKVNF